MATTAAWSWTSHPHPDLHGRTPTDNPYEFWLYETWVDEAAVQAHESGDAFKQYKETLRPLVEPESVLFGNTVPIKVLGYQRVTPRRGRTVRRWR